MTSLFVCTKTSPWDHRPGRVQHVDAREVGEQVDGWSGGAGRTSARARDIVTYWCPHCGVRWTEELPHDE
jgi:hypothetical protein